LNDYILHVLVNLKLSISERYLNLIPLAIIDFPLLMLSLGRSVDFGIMAPTKMNAISRMFANQKAQPSTECPVCNQKASLREIDNHLNNGCPSVPEKAGVERTIDPTAKVRSYDGVILLLA